MIVVIVDKGNDRPISEILLGDLAEVEFAMINGADLGIVVSQRKYKVLRNLTGLGYVGTIAGLGEAVVNRLCLEETDDRG